MSRSRSNREIVEDLELRLGPSFLSKGGMLANNFTRGFPPDLITIDDDDDDDDVQIYSPGPPRETIRFFPRLSSWRPLLTEEDLELRLGLRAYFRHSDNSNGGINISEDGLGDPHSWKCGKKKFELASSGHCTLDVKEVKLRCAICMDAMKEETSTICGHVFCKPCITNAIQVQKKCPACRVKLSMNNIHRIYLPGSTS